MSTWNYLSNSGKVIDFVSFSCEPNTHIFKEPRLFSSTIICYQGHSDQWRNRKEEKLWTHGPQKGTF